jgi:hypothetical protein
MRNTNIHDDHLRSRNQSSAQFVPTVQALAPTGTGPAGTALVASGQPITPITEGIYQAARPVTEMPTLKTLRLYPFGVNRDRLAESARQLRVPVIVTNNERDADAVITLKNYYRRQPDQLQQAEKTHKLIIILKNNTIAQMQQALARIFDIPEIPATSVTNEIGSNDGNRDFTLDDPTKQALLETEDAIHQVLNKGLTTAELPPANAHIRRLQHQMATRYNLLSRSRGKEPYRRVKIFRTHG